MLFRLSDGEFVPAIDGIELTLKKVFMPKKEARKLP